MVLCLIPPQRSDGLEEAERWLLYVVETNPHDMGGDHVGVIDVTEIPPEAVTVFFW